MDDTQDDHPGADDLEGSPVVAERQVEVGRSEELNFAHEEAAFGMAFQDSDLLFHAQNKGGGRIEVVLGNVIPDGNCIRLGSGGDLTPLFFGTFEFFDKIADRAGSATFHVLFGRGDEPCSLKVKPRPGHG